MKLYFCYFNIVIQSLGTQDQGDVNRRIRQLRNKILKIEDVVVFRERPFNLKGGRGYGFFPKTIF